MKLFQQECWYLNTILNVKTQQELINACKNSSVKEILKVTKDPNISSYCLWEQEHS